MEKPWDVHPELTEERLVTVAGILRSVRQDALPFHEPEKGDTSWGLGTRVSERTWHAIRDAAQDLPWLEIIDPRRHFVFSIGGVPFRFYRGRAEKPNPRMLLRQHPEITKHQIAFKFYEEQTQYFWRFAVETDIFGDAFRIVVAQMSEAGDVKMKWDVPLAGKVSALASIIDAKPQGVELQPPVIGGRKKKLRLVPQK